MILGNLICLIWKFLWSRKYFENEKSFKSDSPPRSEADGQTVPVISKCRQVQIRLILKSAGDNSETPSETRELHHLHQLHNLEKINLATIHEKYHEFWMKG